MNSAFSFSGSSQEEWQQDHLIEVFKGLSGLSKTSNCKHGQTIGAQPKWRLGRIKGEKVVSGDLLPSSFFFFRLFLLSLRFRISRVFFSAECSLEIKKKDLSSCC